MTRIIGPAIRIGPEDLRANNHLAKVVALKTTDWLVGKSPLAALHRVEDFFFAVEGGRPSARPLATPGPGRRV